MKRFYLLTLLGALTLIMTCGKTEAGTTPEPEKPPVTTNGVIGHVQYLADIIREATGGELFEIRTEQIYPASHQPLVNQAAMQKMMCLHGCVNLDIEQCSRFLEKINQ